MELKRSGRRGREIVFVTLLLSAVLSGCEHLSSGGVMRPLPSRGTVIRIGYQKGGSLNLLRLRGDLERQLSPQGVTVRWLNFPAGPQMMEGIGASSIDIGSAGDTPPIFAQAAGVPLVYVANTPPSPRDDGTGQALIVPPGSKARTLADLRGKKIAFQKGSSAHYFLVQALQQAGLKYTDVKPVTLSPPDAQSAFSAGSLDGWVIWDPFLSIAERNGGARVLRDGKGLPTSGGFYLASREFAVQHPELVRALLKGAKEAGDWSHEHPHEAATILAPNIGLDVPTLERILRRGATTSYRAITPEVVALQQKESDAFYQIGLLPHRVLVAQDTLTAAQYALLSPAQATPLVKAASAKSDKEQHGAHFLVSAHAGR